MCLFNSRYVILILSVRLFILFLLFYLPLFQIIVIWHYLMMLQSSVHKTSIHIKKSKQNIKGTRLIQKVFFFFLLLGSSYSDKKIDIHIILLSYILVKIYRIDSDKKVINFNTRTAEQANLIRDGKWYINIPNYLIWLVNIFS